MENWKDIKEFEDYYEVSDLGRVRSKTRYIKNGLAGNCKQHKNAVQA